MLQYTMQYKDSTYIQIRKSYIIVCLGQYFSHIVDMRLLTIVLFIPLISADCPEGWWRAGYWCYYTSHDHVTWFEAQQV